MYGPVLLGENHRMQLAGYAMLVEASPRLPVELAFVYRIPDNEVLPVPITPELRRRVVEALAGIRRIREMEICPEATEVWGRCVECEYANFCANVW